MTLRMTLYSNVNSPFARKARAGLFEAGLADSVDIVETVTSVLQPDPALCKVNPLGRLPALVLPDGEAVWGSSVIIAFCDSVLPGRLLPADPALRRRDLTLDALGDGISETAVAARYEAVLRPAALQWKDWRGGLLTKVGSALDYLETRPDLLPGTLTAGAISLACAAAYLDLRLPDLDWRCGRPRLCAWEASISTRPALRWSMLVHG